MNMEKRTLLTAVAFLWIIAAGAAAAPAISVDSNTYNFGTALEGSFVIHRFVITNLGDQTLQILKVRSTCGCTTSSLATNTLAPGASVELEVAFDTRGYGGQTVTKTLYVESNDPGNPQLSLRLTGTVTRPAAYNIGLADLEHLVYLLVDLRSPEAYAESHIIGAVNIPYEQFAATAGLLPLILIIVYDEDGTKGDEIAQMLIENRRRDARSLIGGFAMWVRQMGTELLWPLGQ